MAKRYNVGPVLPHVQKAADYLGERFGIRVVGGFRAANDGGYHPLGRALDFMCTTEQGDKLAAFAWDNRTSLGVIEVIWRQRIITTARAGEGWRAMADRGSPTQNHMDHVHVSFSATPGKLAMPDSMTDKLTAPAIPGMREVGDKVTDAAKGAVSGLDAMGSFAAKLGEQRTWVRVLQVLGGAGLVVAGTVIVGKGVIVDTALSSIPGGGAIKAAAGSLK